MAWENQKFVLKVRGNILPPAFALVVAICVKMGHEEDDKFSEELVEFQYAPSLDV